MHSGWGAMGLDMLGMAFFWIVVLVALIVLARNLFGGPRPPRDDDKTALEILEARYARGEIGREEFERRRHDLAE
jgi:putative membrane protein